MKKSMLYVLGIGTVMGTVFYLVSKKSKFDVSDSMHKENEFRKKEMKPDISAEEFVSASDFEGEIMDAKSESAHLVQERHQEVANAMHNAFKNIYEDIESEEHDMENSDSYIQESAIHNSEMDSISNELDDLLK